MDVRDSFGKALRFVRQRKGLSQEDFSLISSRNFVGMLERGTTGLTLEKLNSLCTVLGVHPVTLLAMTYLADPETSDESEKLLKTVSSELKDLLGNSKVR
ncbi:MAG: helix-turn-helix transcriptional regulator [Pseudomonas sp.]|nr:helix-turn-helix transcriptional regulator [Pseudomonas sp.]